MYVIDWEILLHAYDIYAQDAEENNNGRICTRISAATGKVFTMYQTAAFLAGFVPPCLSDKCLLSSPYLELSTPIFTLVLAPCKSIGICKFTQLTLEIFTLAFEFGSRVCFWSISPIHALCIMLWLMSQTSCMIYERLLAQNWTERCPTGMHLQHTGRWVLSSNCSPYTPTSAGLHYLIIPTFVCKQQQTKSISCLPK